MNYPNEKDWASAFLSLNARGYAVLPKVLSVEECKSVCTLYEQDDLYRNVIDMKRYRFGQGKYKYFRYPLPDLVRELRESFYPPLSTIANQWSGQLALGVSYPGSHDAMIEMCHVKNQTRPTPLILRYEVGGFNTLHQDLYGEVYFPFQLVIALSQHGLDHEGGEFVLTQQTPRAQSKAEVIRPNQGDAVIFTTNFRPVNGTRGFYRAKVKHGVSEVRSGTRHALGIIFHDAA